MSERYLYEIRPVRPISIPGKPKMRQSTCALLTKEEVLEYMKYGAIYRKYADPNMAPVKVMIPIEKNGVLTEYMITTAK